MDPTPPSLTSLVDQLRQHVTPLRVELLAYATFFTGVLFVGVTHL